jgi:hypothetical protein
MGAFVPHLGFCQVHLSDVLSRDPTTLSIAHFELLAFLIGFLFTMFLNPASTAIHLFVDNQNALAWSEGHIGTNDNVANILTLTNCFLQVGFNVMQTRQYIRSQENIQADQISRRIFANLDKLTQFYPSSHLMTFFRELLGQLEVDVSRILQLLLTLLEYPVSALFVKC